MARRDNTDKIDPDLISIRPHDDHDLIWAWRRKDKLEKKLHFVNNTMIFQAEEVVWSSIDMWVITPRGERWRAGYAFSFKPKSGKHVATVDNKRIFEYKISLDDMETIPEPGSEFGLVMSAQGVRSAIRKYRRPENKVIPPPLAWPRVHPSPQLVMAPAEGVIGVTEIDELYEEFIVGHGFHGFHVPMLGGTVSDALLKLLEYADLHEFWVHMWMYSDVQHGWAPEDVGSDEARQHQSRVLRDIEGFKNWSMGLGTDLWEWTTREQVNEWVTFMRNAGERGIFGGRQQPGKKPYFGGYVGWEQIVEDKSKFEKMLKDGLRASKGKRVMSEDRFRDRAKEWPGGKDWDYEEMIDGMKLCIQHGYAAIWGYRSDDQNINLAGSQPFPNRSEIRTLLRGDEPPPPPEPEPLPNEWGLVAFSASKRKRKAMKEHLPQLRWIRIEASPTQLGWDFDRAVKLCQQAYDAGYEVMLGTAGTPGDYNAGKRWQDWTLDLVEALNRDAVWIIADTETGDPKFIQGGAQQYINNWKPVIKKLRARGHKIAGPGMVHGNVRDLEAILAEIQFDAVSIHVYTDRGEQATESWISEATRICKEAGYEWGMLGETAVHGAKITWSEKLSCSWNGDEQQIKRATQLKATLDAHPFWRLKLWYQILDRQRAEVGHGLFNEVDEQLEPKPVIKKFQQWLKK